MIVLENFAAVSLVGKPWEGSYVEAAAGAIGELMTSLRNDLEQGPNAPLLGVSWTEQPGRFRHFVGIRTISPAPVPQGLHILELPELSCLTCQHPGGDATQAYARLMAERDKRGFGEGRHPNMIDEHLPDGSMRLWLPIVRA